MMVESPAQKWGRFFDADIEIDNMRVQLKYFYFGFVA